MSIRKLFFWAHLVLGCTAAVFIFLMSITGVGLTYERQMIHFAEKLDYPKPPHPEANKLPLDYITKVVSDYPHKKPIKLVIRNEKNAFVEIKEGRSTLAYLNPYTGSEISAPGEGTKTFLKKLRAFHRWLTLDGSFSNTGRWVNGIANIIFGILLISGVYLWLPKRLNKRALKQKLTFSKKYPSVNARDYQWHNVYGIYLAPVLFIIIVTAFFFSFKWPGSTLKELVSTKSLATQVKAIPISTNITISQQALFNNVSDSFKGWQKIQFVLPSSSMNSQEYQVDLGNGGEPQKRYSVTLDSITGNVIQQTSFDDMSTYRKARSYIRFLHTGEAFGLLGQTLAGVASLLACLLIYTGLMMSIRRWKNYQKKKVEYKDRVLSNY